MAGAVLGVCVLAGCSSRDVADSKPIPVVQIAEPATMPMQETTIYTGRLEAAQTVMLRARVSGYLQAIRFKDGDWVQAGAPLFDLDPSTFSAGRDRDSANLQMAQAHQALAHQIYDRDVALRQGGSVSVEEVQQSAAERSSADAAVAAAKAQLKASGLDLSYTNVTAPITGLVSDRRVDIGNFVTGGSGQGTLLATIVTLDPIRVMFDVSEADYQRLAGTGFLKKGTKLPIEIGDETNWSRKAELEFSNNEEDRDSGTIRLRAVLHNADHTLLPGLFARIKLPLGGPQVALTVPDTAVLSDQSRRLVMVVDKDSKVVPRVLALGGLSGTQRFVLGGLDPHDRVIVGGLAKVRPGDQVKVGPMATPGGK